MRVRIVAIGARAADWVNDGFEDYRRRIGAFALELDLIRPPSRRGGDVEGALAREGERLLERAASADRLVALHEHGEAMTSRQFATHVDGWRHSHREVCLLIGGADGLSETVLRRTHERLSLSRFTLPHALARLVLAEQLYRATTLLAGRPYHRD